jgi:hypothetical protein
VQDEESPFFTTPHFDGHPSVLVRACRMGELTLAELTEVVQDAWLSRASPRRTAGWLAAHAGTSPMLRILDIARVFNVTLDEVFQYPAEA